MAIDLVFFFLVAAGFYLGYQKGVMGIFITSFLLLAGFSLGVRITPRARLVLVDFFGVDGVLMPLLAFALSFLLSTFLVQVVVNILQQLISINNWDLLNKIASGAFVASVFIFLYSGIVWFLEESTILTPELKKDAISIAIVDTLLEELEILLRTVLRGVADLTEEIKLLFKDMQR